MQIKKLPANGAYAIVFGDSIVRLDKDMPMFWNRREDLITALDSRGIEVIDRKGTLRSKPERTQE